MSLESSILKKIDKLSCDLIIALYNSRMLLKEINKSIKTNNNTYFDENSEIMYRLNSILNDKGLKELMFLLTDYKNYISEKQKDCCNHKWITDLIDIDPDRSKIIVYCELCEITKK
jgi:hypothetical protein